jgi:hypothetical protein
MTGNRVEKTTAEQRVATGTVKRSLLRGRRSFGDLAQPGRQASTNAQFESRMTRR